MVLCLNVGISLGWSPGLIIGPLLGLPAGCVTGFIVRPIVTSIAHRFRGSLRVGLSVGLSVGLGIGSGSALGLIVFGAVTGHLLAGLAFGLLLGLFAGLSFGLVVGLIAGLAGEIRFVEALRWSWTTGLSVGLLAWIGFTIVGQEELVALRAGLSLGLLVGVTGRDVEIRMSHYQGMWQAVRNMLLGAGMALLIGLIWGYTTNLKTGLQVGLLIGLIWGMRGGLIACIQHVMLRILLYWKGAIPRDYARFLNYSADRLFLQRVGTGYIFVHRLLLEHFASYEPPAVQQAPEVLATQPVY
jgi:hypothetical protein